MPIFEFVCDECGQHFEELVRSSSAIGEVVCPACQSEQVKKRVSLFAARVNSPAGFSSSAYTNSCNTGST